ncbi:MAG: tRNA-dihydrouridine synthase, partial [Hyphomicrobiaceae bacterium]|nr:tRNA-dihydrouridine synthase [Hyphomicrobiaceae bacterium]
RGLDGAMLGRAAFQNPDLLFDVDRKVFGEDRRTDPSALIDTMAAYIDAHVAEGGRASHVTKAMIGLFQGVPGARRWRQILSTRAHEDGADSRVLREAFAAVASRLAERAA